MDIRVEPAVASSGAGGIGAIDTVGGDQPADGAAPARPPRQLTAHPPRPRDPLEGREVEQGTLRIALGRLTVGRGGVVVVRGPAGSGKTMLIDEVLADATRTTAIRVTTTGSDPDTPLGLWCRLTAAVTALWRGAPPVGATGLDAAHWVRPELQPKPVVLVVEGLDQADAASAAMLNDLARSAPALPLLLILVGRPGGPVAALTSSPPPGTSVIDLQPLRDDQVAAVAGAAGVTDPKDRERIVRLAAGSPLVAHRVAESLAAGGGAVPAAHDVLAARLAAIDEVGAVLALALFDRPVTASLLTNVLDVDPRLLRSTLDAVIAGGFVERFGVIGLYRLALPQVADAVLATAEPEDTRRTHLRIAAALDTSGSAGGVFAEATRHLIAAGIGGDQVARACLDAALRAELLQRHAEAEEFAAYGLDSGAVDVTLRVGLRRVLGRCLARAGRTTAARDVLLEALDLATDFAPTARAEVVADLAVADLAWVPVGPERIPLLESARADVPPGSTPHTRLTAALAAAVYLGDQPRGRRLAAAAMAAAADCSDDGTTLAAATYASLLGEPPARASALTERIVAAWQSSPVAGRPPPVVHLGAALAAGDRPGADYLLAKAEHAPDGFPIALETGLCAVARLCRAVLDADAGEVARLVGVLRCSDGDIVPPLAAVAQLSWTIHSGTWLDLPPATLAALMPTSGFGRLFLVGTQAVSLMRLRRDGQGADGTSTTGERAATLASLARHRAELLAVPDDLTHDVVAGLLGLLGHEVRDEQMCRAAVDALAGHAHEFVVLAGVVPIAPVGWFLAWAYQGLGDRTAALMANAAARTTSDRLRARTWTLQCDHQLAFLLRRSDPARSRQLAARTAEEAEQLGLHGISGRARELTPADRRPNRALPGGRQGEILRLAASGLTNEQIARRLFLSVSTVERHFTQLYRKLEVRNRAEAIGLLVDTTLSDERDRMPGRQRGA